MCDTLQGKLIEGHIFVWLRKYMTIVQQKNNNIETKLLPYNKIFTFPLRSPITNTVLPDYTICRYLFVCQWVYRKLGIKHHF